jgi:hypothetical protein
MTKSTLETLDYFFIPNRPVGEGTFAMMERRIYCRSLLDDMILVNSSECILLDEDLENLLLERRHQGSSADLTSKIEEALRCLRHMGITLASPTNVRSYLLRHIAMTDLLPLICSIAREEFGMEAELSLEVYHDPEIEDEYLTLYVRMKEYDDDFMQRIEAVSVEFEDMLSERSGWFLLTTDFRPAKAD